MLLIGLHGACFQAEGALLAPGSKAAKPGTKLKIRGFRLTWVVNPIPSN
jgi:hypothetical protein